jgi:apolipoprotein N-acyltransferase
MVASSSLHRLFPQSRFIQALIAFMAGAVGVLGFAPFYAWPCVIISIAILFALWREAHSAKHAALIGFVWGLGLFLFGVSWLYVAIHVYGNMPVPLAASAIFLFCCYLSLYPMFAGMLIYKLGKKYSQIISLLVILPASFVAFEYLRGWIVTGFPWLIAGYSQTPGGVIAAPLAGYAPLFGMFGITWLLAITAGVIVLLTAERKTLSSRTKIVVPIITVIVWLAGFGLQSISWSAPSGAPLSVALLQGNIAQDLKWREDELTNSLLNYQELVLKSKTKLIVLPETAAPIFFDQLPPDYLTSLKLRAQNNGGDLLIGAPYSTPANSNAPQPFFNSAISMGVSPSQRYSKDHLVAFGEFIPPLFSWVYQWLSIPLSGFTPGGKEQAPMRLANHLIAINICYEDAFGSEVARPLPDAELLVNMSNMAWYGHSLAAEQHVQFSQMRAMETSRWMLRSTNTGVTAAVNERGEIVKALPQFTRGTLEVDAVPRQGATPYVRWRDAPVLIFLVVMLLGPAVIKINGAVQK